MKIQKKFIIYIGLLIFNIFIIGNTFHVAFSDVMISKIHEEVTIFLLTLNTYFYMIVGLMLTGLVAYLIMHLAVHKVGKLFTIYIAMASLCICLIAATNYKYKPMNITLGLLAFLSNLILFYSIGCLTLIYKKKYYRWMMAGYILITICGEAFYLFCVSRNNLDLYGDIITLDYIITIIVIIVSLLIGYKDSTRYSKQQIKFLTIGLVLGIIIFIIMHSLPMLAVVAVPENNPSVVDYQVKNIGTYEQEYPIIQVENIRGQHNIYPIMIFTGIVIVMVYILIKREYFIIGNMGELRSYMVSIAYLIVANTLFYFIISIDLGDFITFNTILSVPLLLYSHRVFQKGNHLYDNSMVEILEEERQKLSVFLHDEVLQGLIAMLHSLNAQDISDDLSVLIAEIRNVSQDLYPTIAEDLGVEEALRIFLHEINSDYNVEAEYQYSYPQGVLPKGISLVIYRIIKELVTNAIKHSGCVKIMVTISEAPGGIQCIVFDDGKGFQIPESDKLLKDHHMGLYTIRKQIADLDGKMRIISDTTGSEFSIFIPLR